MILLWQNGISIHCNSKVVVQIPRRHEFINSKSRVEYVAKPISSPFHHVWNQHNNTNNKRNQRVTKQPTRRLLSLHCQRNPHPFFLPILPTERESKNRRIDKIKVLLGLEIWGAVVTSYHSWHRQSKQRKTKESKNPLMASAVETTKKERKQKPAQRFLVILESIMCKMRAVVHSIFLFESTGAGVPLLVCFFGWNSKSYEIVLTYQYTRQESLCFLCV